MTIDTERIASFKAFLVQDVPIKCHLKWFCCSLQLSKLKTAIIRHMAKAFAFFFNEKGQQRLKS